MIIIIIIDEINSGWFFLFFLFGKIKWKSVTHLGAATCIGNWSTQRCRNIPSHSWTPTIPNIKNTKKHSNSTLPSMGNVSSKSITRIRIPFCLHLANGLAHGIVSFYQKFMFQIPRGHHTRHVNPSKYYENMRSKWKKRRKKKWKYFKSKSESEKAKSWSNVSHTDGKRIKKKMIAKTTMRRVSASVNSTHTHIIIIQRLECHTKCINCIGSQEKMDVKGMVKTIGAPPIRNWRGSEEGGKAKHSNGNDITQTSTIAR